MRPIVPRPRRRVPAVDIANRIYASSVTKVPTTLIITTATQ